jgi:hypothetical protein
MKTAISNQQSAISFWCISAAVTGILLLWMTAAQAQTPTVNQNPCSVTLAHGEGHELTCEEQKDLVLARKDQQIAASNQELAKQEYILAQQQVNAAAQNMQAMADKIREAHKWPKDKTDFDASNMTFSAKPEANPTPAPVAKK